MTVVGRWRTGRVLARPEGGFAAPQMPETRIVGLQAHTTIIVSVADKPAVSQCAVCRDAADGHDASLDLPICRSCAQRLDEEVCA